MHLVQINIILRLTAWSLHFTDSEVFGSQLVKSAPLLLLAWQQPWQQHQAGCGDKTDTVCNSIRNCKGGRKYCISLASCCTVIKKHLLPLTYAVYRDGASLNVKASDGCGRVPQNVGNLSVVGDICAVKADLDVVNDRPISARGRGHCLKYLNSNTNL